MQYFSKTNIDFVGKRKGFFYFSVILTVVGILSVITMGIEYGIDFVGGSEMAYEFSQPIEPEQLRNAIEKGGIRGSEIKSYGEDNQYLVRIKEAGEIQGKVDTLLAEAFPNQNVTNLKTDKIGPKIGAELRNQAIIAVFLSLIAILIYIAFRFEFVFGLGAVVAIFHDVIITFSLIVIINKLGLVDIEMNQNILAAMLTVIGYSINDTVIIFDRIRENKDKHKGMAFTKLCNLSINETLSRTINTVTTTVLVLITTTLFGGPVLQGFALTMLIGIIFGTYSSVYIASNFVIWYLEKVKKNKVEDTADKKVAAAKA